MSCFYEILREEVRLSNLNFYNISLAALCRIDYREARKKAGRQSRGSALVQVREDGN